MQADPWRVEARTQQQRRRPDGTGRQDDAIARDLLAGRQHDTDCTAAVQHHTFNGGIGSNGQIRSRPCGPEVRLSRGDPATVTPSERHASCVTVSADERPIDRAEFALERLLLGERHRRPGRLGIVPSPRPIQVRIATQGNHGVDHRRTTETPATAIRARRASGGPCGQHVTVVAVRQTGRAEEVVGVDFRGHGARHQIGARLHQHHLTVGILRQTGGDHASGSSGTHHDPRPGHLRRLRET